MDRIALCEVYSCLAHDFGLYRLNSRLDRMGFKPRLTLRTENLEPEQLDAYNELASKIESNQISETNEGRLL